MQKRITKQKKITRKNSMQPQITKHKGKTKKHEQIRNHIDIFLPKVFGMWGEGQVNQTRKLSNVKFYYLR